MPATVTILYSKINVIYIYGKSMKMEAMLDKTLPTEFAPNAVVSPEI
jgi:hypothetical protein